MPYITDAEHPLSDDVGDDLDDEWIELPVALVCKEFVPNGKRKVAALGTWSPALSEIE